MARRFTKIIENRIFAQDALGGKSGSKVDKGVVHGSGHSPDQGPGHRTSQDSEQVRQTQKS